jgi:hypothetical protein
MAPVRSWRSDNASGNAPARALRLGLIVALVAAAGCTEADLPPGSADSSSGDHRAIRLAADALTSLPPEAVERLAVQSNHDGAAFGRVRDLALDEAGFLYVLDSHARQVLVFDAAGQPVRAMSRQGTGPGEMESPRGMRWGSPDRLWVMDFRGNRYVEFSATGEPLATFQRQVLPYGADWLGSFDQEGRLHDVASVRQPESGETRLVLIRHQHAGEQLVPADTFTLPVTGADNYLVEFPAGLLNIPVPFAPAPTWIHDGDGAVWSSNAADYVLLKTALRGDTLLSIHLDRTAQPVSREQRARAVAELDSLVEALGGNARLLDFSRIPSRYPAHGPLRIDEKGRLWVAHYAAEVEPSGTFDIFEPSGEPLGSVTLGISSRLPMAFNGGFVAGVMRDAMDAEHVVVYRLRF